VDGVDLTASGGHLHTQVGAAHAGRAVDIGLDPVAVELEGLEVVARAQAGHAVVHGGPRGVAGGRAGGVQAVVHQAHEEALAAVLQRVAAGVAHHRAFTHRVHG